MGPPVHLAVGVIGLVLLVGLLLGGILLFLVLRRPRRRGTTPHCARCDYNLTGLTSERCPECGTEMIPANIVYGELVGRPWSKVAAWVCVAAFGFVAAQWAWHYDWYHIRPTAWVLSDLQSAGPTANSRAWRELDRRIRAGSLSKSQESRLIDICLAEQGAKTVTLTSLIDYLGASLLGGRMSQSQQAAFFKQIVQLEMIVRPTVIAGGSIPFNIQHTSRGPSQPGLWISLKEEGAAKLDGKPTKRSRGSMGSSGMSGYGAGGGSSSSIPLAEWEGPIAAGRHRLATTVQIEVRDAYPADQKKTICLHRADIPLEADFEVLASEPAGYIKLIDDPSQKAALQSAIQPKNVRPTRHDKGIEFTLECKNVPISIAFELLARTGKGEQHLTTIHLAKGKSTNWSTSIDRVPTDGPFDLILRGSKKVAMDTVDLFEIWQGELVYPGLRVESEGSPTDTAGSTTAP